MSSSSTSSSSAGSADCAFPEQFLGLFPGIEDDVIFDYETGTMTLPMWHIKCWVCGSTGTCSHVVLCPAKKQPKSKKKAAAAEEKPLPEPIVVDWRADCLNNVKWVCRNSDHKGGACGRLHCTCKSACPVCRRERCVHAKTSAAIPEPEAKEEKQEFPDPFASPEPARCSSCLIMLPATYAGSICSDCLAYKKRKAEDADETETESESESGEVAEEEEEEEEEETKPKKKRAKKELPEELVELRKHNIESDDLKSDLCVCCLRTLSDSEKAAAGSCNLCLRHLQEVTEKLSPEVKERAEERLCGYCMAGESSFLHDKHRDRVVQCDNCDVRDLPELMSENDDAWAKRIKRGDKRCEGREASGYICGDCGEDWHHERED